MAEHIHTYADRRPASWSAATAAVHLPPSGGPARFGAGEQDRFPYGRCRTAESLVATLGTKAGLLVLPKPEQGVRAGWPETAAGGFVLSMLTGVLWARRL
ncbi:hypothetical protein [Kitasatospora sp. NPDC004531]